MPRSTKHEKSLLHILPGVISFHSFGARDKICLPGKYMPPWPGTRGTKSAWWGAAWLPPRGPGQEPQGARLLIHPPSFAGRVTLAKRLQPLQQPAWKTVCVCDREGRPARFRREKYRMPCAYIVHISMCVYAVFH